jgi:ribonucleoside-diphosphate reductase alpha chain
MPLAPPRSTHLKPATTGKPADTPAVPRLNGSGKTNGNSHANGNGNGNGHGSHDTQSPSGGAMGYQPTEGTQAERIRVARQKGYEGDPCSNCQAMTLVRSGACLRCDTCGATSGCG